MLTTLLFGLMADTPEHTAETAKVTDHAEKHGKKLHSHKKTNGVTT